MCIPVDLLCPKAWLLSVVVLGATLGSVMCEGQGVPGGQYVLGLVYSEFVVQMVVKACRQQTALTA